MNRLLYIIIAILFQVACAQKNPALGKWDIQDDLRDNPGSLCLRIVITEDLFVCDGKRRLVDYKLVSQTLVVIPRGTIHGSFEVRIVNADTLEFQLISGKSAVYTRVKPWS